MGVQCRGVGGYQGAEKQKTRQRSLLSQGIRDNGPRFKPGSATMSKHVRLELGVHTWAKKASW